jgi:hypothetical protein
MRRDLCYLAPWHFDCLGLEQTFGLHVSLVASLATAGLSLFLGAARAAVRRSYLQTKTEHAEGKSHYRQVEFGVFSVLLRVEAAWKSSMEAPAMEADR